MNFKVGDKIIHYSALKNIDNILSYYVIISVHKEYILCKRCKIHPKQSQFKSNHQARYRVPISTINNYTTLDKMYENYPEYFL